MLIFWQRHVHPATLSSLGVGYAGARPRRCAGRGVSPRRNYNAATIGSGALRFAIAAGIRVHVLAEGERYRDLSPALRRLGIDVDSWPAPPAGLFVVEERRVYLRALGAMTVAHEFGHALDCALGGGTYRSAVDPAIRRASRTRGRSLHPMPPPGSTSISLRRSARTSAPTIRSRRGHKRHASDCAGSIRKWRRSLRACSAASSSA